jgi:CubicO group peptidase (beta-lactamase class C family)
MTLLRALAIFAILFELAFCRLALNELEHDWKEAVNTAKGQKRSVHATHDDLVANLELFFTSMNGCETMQVPGSAVTVIKEGTVVLEKAYGKSDLENNVDATVDTVFGIGSTTKAITGFIVGSLVDDGKFAFDTKISDVIPDWYSTSVYVSCCYSDGSDQIFRCDYRRCPSSQTGLHQKQLSLVLQYFQLRRT